MNLSFKNRIALNYMTATALVMAVVFASVFLIVKTTVISNVDNDLEKEAQRHLTEIEVEDGTLKFEDEEEWEELEHHEIAANPMFVQLMNSKARIVEKSPNLKGHELDFDLGNSTRRYSTSFFRNRHLRQLQVPVIRKEKTYGHVIVAVSLEPSLMVIDKLRDVLLISYPIILFGLFFISRYLAGRSIIPISAMRDTANRITRYNLNERVPLPPNRDELYGLSTSINELLQRIEDAMQRERQFTSDASHELRTPLSVLRGTLEVLIRKPRTQQEYEEKVKKSLVEIDRLSEIMEQLLALARFSELDKLNTGHQMDLVDVVETTLILQANQAKAQEIQINLINNLSEPFLVSQENVQLILGNLVQNAIKYSRPSSRVNITLKMVDGKPVCQVFDEGIGIKEADLLNIFNPFYRSNPMQHREIAGNGLGLAIAQRAAQAIGGEILVTSEFNKGSVFTLKF